MGRTMAVTAAAVVCGGLVGFGATSYATTTVTPGGAGAYAAGTAADDEEEGSREDHHGPHFALSWGNMLHGETVTEDPETGELVHHVQQQGEVVERGDGTVTVESSDGTTWEWTLTDDTAIHTEGGGEGDAEASGIEVGDTVMAGGVREGDVRTAHHIGDPAPEPGEIREEIERGLEGLPEDLELPELEDLPRWFDEHGGDGEDEQDGQEEQDAEGSAA
ncbi:hypothetical protein [Streptomyces sp. 6N223]|uniref:hypothetical protein n=1 Tax=Streptomyces sp. 6N223 TaxID=3457412 RepID=UPI003FCF1750